MSYICNRNEKQTIMEYLLIAFGIFIIAAGLAFVNEARSQKVSEEQRS